MCQNEASSVGFQYVLLSIKILVSVFLQSQNFILFDLCYSFFFFAGYPTNSVRKGKGQGYVLGGRRPRLIIHLVLGSIHDCTWVIMLLSIWVRYYWMCCYRPTHSENKLIISTSRHTNGNWYFAINAMCVMCDINLRLNRLLAEMSSNDF
jgi:hypothetical protein